MLSTKKTKVLVVGRDAAAQNAEPVIMMRGEQLEVVSQFKDLGSIFTSDCTLDAEITHRVVAANSAFQQLRRANIWSSRALTLSFKMQFSHCIVKSVLLYAGETWPVVQKHISPLAVFQMNCLHCIFGISLRDYVPNVDILTRCNTFSAKDLDGYVICSRCLMIGCLRSFCLVKSRAAAPRAALALVSMMLQCVIVNCVA